MPQRNLLTRLLGLSIACGCGVHSGTGRAADVSPPISTAPTALEEIVVSATKTNESLQRVPISITAYTQADLNASGAHTLGDIARLTPGVDFQESSGFGTPQFNIAVRGISSSTSASTTNVYLDDTPLDSRTDQMSAAGAPFPRAFDLERVEVLRGPQGTLFGASAEGGAIRFITPTPNLADYSAYVRSEVSTTEYGAPSYEAGAAFGGPLINDKVGIRISAWYRKDGGYVDLVTPPLGAGPFTQTTVAGTGGALVESNANHSDAKVFRAALRFEPSDWLAIQPAIFYQRSSRQTSDLFDLSLSNPAQGKFNDGLKAPIPATDRFSLPSLKVEAGLDTITLTSITSYFDRAATAETDYTEYQTFAFFGNPWQLLPCLPAGPNCPPDEFAHAYWTTNQTKWTQELRLSSREPDAKFKWVVGLYYENAKQHDSQYAFNNDIAQLLHTYYGKPLATAVQDTLGSPLVDGIWLYTGHTYLTDKQTAVFGEATYRATEKLKLTAGLRAEHVSNTFASPVDGPFNGGPHYYSGAQSENPVNPRVSVSWQQNADDLYYMTAAKGFRPGGSNSQPSTTPTCVAALQAFGLSNGIPATYSSDSLWSYEIGAKLGFADQRLRLDASAFHIDWKNIQNLAQINGCGTAVTFNLGKATSNGFDIALDAALTKSLVFGTTVSYVKATYDETVGAGSSIVVSKGDWVGGTGIQAGVLPSPWTISAHGRYQFATYGGSNGYVWLEDVYHAANPGPVSTQNPNDTLSYDAALTQNPSTNVLNARLGVTIGKLDLSLFANNVLNSHPLLDRFHALAFDDRLQARTLRPLTIGLTMTLGL